MKKVIELKNVTASYGKNIVLKDINFSVYKGEQVFILGGNGSGKTTLIKTILGLVSQSNGEVRILGKKRNQQLIAENIGYVPQTTSGLRMFPISVAEVIKIECRLSDHCPVGVVEHLNKFNAGNLADKKISDLSGGEFQKVLIARAFVTEPKILILDEPTNNLDMSSSMKLKEILAKYKDEGNTIITISHDDDVVDETKIDSKSRVIKLEEGKITTYK